ncbi:hypothetical protein PAECIP111893_02242 [Paenibacillus plantiphilus]|uniref:Uncharacterized protein n=1 Tax=Paenibacillus plantiphilus TaxID=2905650 RepID=A0ABM9C7L2_9BACL|nr:hypothetical protein [Paenibacillus plantiphilus]CAH1204396.1 hypothetical protein PAECIP111893_02242 [Paenibacillus plantiphilus]
MAFVYEKISEADQGRFQSFNLRSPFNGRPLETRKWIVDRERDAYLVSMGGQGTYDSEIPMFHALIWNGNTINIDSFTTGTGDVSIGIEKFWKITRIEAPVDVREKEDELLDLIKDAFDAKGFAGSKDCVVNVHFDFIAAPEFRLGVKKLDHC